MERWRVPCRNVRARTNAKHPPCPCPCAASLLAPSTHARRDVCSEQIGPKRTHCRLPAAFERYGYGWRRAGTWTRTRTRAVLQPAYHQPLSASVSYANLLSPPRPLYPLTCAAPIGIARDMTTRTRVEANRVEPGRN
ncbi:hypothetical protein BDW22DRAFT_953160 [Trametopsis cervina]|nr:hypothetical protein BDW22DRAFT_953160 [Trametopsis cervina]